MQIYINHILAAIKKGSSFDFVTENRYFSGADSYTLAITFPLKDCPQNLAIFGHINRKDVVAQHLLFDCEIRDRAFVKYGYITITEISDIEVKCQFLEGRSVQNYDVTFDEIYINELDLGYPIDSSNAVNSKNLYPTSNLLLSHLDGANWHALPWVNNYSGNLQNQLQQYGDGTWHWHTSTPTLSFQPYLIYIIEKIFETQGYTCDLSVLRNSPYANLLICNTLPSAWGIYNFARALPHWTLTEFIEQVELLFDGFFDIDTNSRTVRFSSTQSTMPVEGLVILDRVLDSFTCKNETSATASAKGYAVRYADCDHRMWKYYSCQWFIDRCENGSWGCRNENTVDDALNFLRMDDEWATYVNFGMVFRVGTHPPYRYYNYRTLKVNDAGNNQYRFVYALQRLNLCGAPDTDEDTKEMKLVPVWLDMLNENSGYVIFLQCPQLEQQNRYSNDINQSDSEYVIAQGGQQIQSQFFDKIYIGTWAGGTIYHSEIHPSIDDVDFITRNTYRNGVSLDIANFNNERYMGNLVLDKSLKYTFSWLSDEIPNPRSMFIIQGRRYVCEKITANFTENGMSRLLKGDFYPVAD